jgi:FKBP-type peptidyl-prolyl cis-trans isomerase FklB
MKSYAILAFLLGLSVAAVAQDCPVAGSGTFKNERYRASYAFGMNVGRGWKAGQVDFDPDLVGRGLQECLAGGAALLTKAEAAEALARFNQELKTLQQRRIGQPGNANPPQDESPGSVGNGPFKNMRDRASYAWGMDLGRGWKEEQIDLDPATFTQGLKDSLASKAKRLSDAEMADTLAGFGRELRVVQQRHRDEVAEENRRQGEAFLARNKTFPGVVSLPSGLQYQVIVQGTGPCPELRSWVKLEYRGTRIDGTEFESSAAHPEAGIVGLGSVTQGWAEALQMMQPGAEWRLFVPPSLAYGNDGSPGVGRNETLIYDIKLASILPGQPPPTAEDLKNERGPDGD